MDYIYLVDLKTYLSDDELKLNDFCNCSLSNKNILAFSNDCYVYLLPLEKPNELMPVFLANSQCIYLAWSDDGNYLINIYKNGLINLFSVKTNLLNSIEVVHSFQIEKNDLLTVKSFSKLPKLCFDYEKRDSSNYFEKYYYKSFNFLKNFSKLQYNGFLFLTKCGVMHIVITDFNSVKARYEKFEYDMKLSQLMVKEEMVTDAQSPDQDQDVKFDLGDFSFETDGSIIVAFTNAELTSPVYILKVNLQFSNDGSSISGTTNIISTVSINTNESTLMSTKTKLLFTSNESAQLFTVCLRSTQTNCDLIQVWRPSQLNQNLIGSFDMNSEQCSLVKSIQCPSSLIQLSVPKASLAFRDLVENRCLNDFSLYLIASYQNGTCGFIDVQTFNQTFISAIPTQIESGPGDVESIDLISRKKFRFMQEFLVVMDQSFSGSIGVGITNFSRLVTFRQLANQHTGLNSLLNLYEYMLLTGYDYWDLLINTNPKVIDGLIDRMEDKFSNQLLPSLQKIYFSKHNSMLYSLFKLSSNYTKYRSQDVLTKLVLNRCMSIISFSMQLNLNLDQVVNSPQYANFINKNNSPPSINISLLNSNLDLGSGPSSMQQQQTNPIILNYLNQIQFKGNFYDYVSEILKLKIESKNELKIMLLNDIVHAVFAKKNFQLNVNQQLKHIFQWIIDIALYLTSIAPLTRLNQSSSSSAATANASSKSHLYGSSLLGDLWFLNEIRKAIVYIKLIFVQVNQFQQQQQQQQQQLSQQQLLAHQFLCESLPVLPLRSSMQKDLLSDLFNIYTKIIYKSFEGGNILSDEAIMDQCLNIQAETIIRPMEEQFFYMKYTCLGNPSSLWLKTLQLKVDEIFETDKSKTLYPLFDINRIIQFSRSASTKQCIRCGNFTESNKSNHQNVNNPKTNCIYMLDSCSEKCICGGYWVLSTLQ